MNKTFRYLSFLYRNTEISATLFDCIAKIRPCYLWNCLFFLTRLKKNSSYNSVLLEVAVFWQIFFCFIDIKPEISATVLECIAKIRPCYRSASATFLERPWSNYTALNAWTSTPPSLQDTITLMGHISALVSHTCFLWCIQNIGKGTYINDVPLF